MKILALFPTYRPSNYLGNVGGGEISNRILLEGLAAAGHQVTVISFSCGGAHEVPRNGVSVLEVPGLSLTKPVDWIAKRAGFRSFGDKHISETRPDIIVATTDAISVAIDLGERYRIPTSIFVRAFENLDPPSVYLRNLDVRWLIKRALLGACGRDTLSKANLLVTNSEFMARACRERVPGVSTAIVYPPLHIQIHEQSSTRFPLVASMVGTSKKKGTELMERIAQQIPEIQFRIIGCPDIAPDAAIRKGNVLYLGWRDIEKEFLENADIVLVPSLCQEAFGRVAIEALAAGRVPLVSDVGGLPEAVAYEPDLIVPANDGSAWISRLRALIKDPAKYRSAATSARAHIRRFEDHVQVSRLADLLERLIEASETGSGSVLDRSIR